MVASNRVGTMVRVLAIIHILVGAWLIIFSIIDGETALFDKKHMFTAGYGFYGVWIGAWMCIAGALGIPGSAPRRTQRRNCFAVVFMGFAITSAVFGGQIIIGYSLTIAHASYSEYCGNSYDLVRRHNSCMFSYGAKMGLAAVILILGVVEFGTGIWVSICLCMMKPCCTDSKEKVAFLSSTPGYVVAQGADGGPVAIPLQAFGVTGQTQFSNGSALAGQTTCVPVPFKAVGNQPHLEVDTLPDGGHLQVITAA